MTKQPRHKALPYNPDLEGINSYRLADTERRQREEAGIEKGGRHKLEKPESARRAVGATVLTRFAPQLGIRKA